MNQYLEILGFKVVDVITGVTGVAESVCFDLYGCVQVIVKPKANDKGEMVEGRWFDFKRLQKFDAPRVLDMPTFEAVGGGSDKPLFPSKPAQ